jgi:hypothetical protein
VTCLGVYLIMVTCLGACLLLVMCMITQKQIAKFEALIVRDVLGSVFVIGDVFGSMFEFGDMFGSASDVDKPTVCLHI